MHGEDPAHARRRTLAERQSGAEADLTLYENVPLWMVRPLVEWLRAVFAPSGFVRTAERTTPEDVARRALSKFRMPTTNPNSSYSLHIIEFTQNTSTALHRDNVTHVEPLDLIDAIIEMHPAWDAEDSDTRRRERWPNELSRLEGILSDCGSEWMVDTELRGLYRRVDPSAVAARREAERTAIAAGRTTAAAHLSNAWNLAYGRDPDFDQSYRSAVLAVEVAACPVVLEKATANGTAQLFQVPGELRKTSKWALVMPDSSAVPPGPGSAELVANMITRLVQGQTQRHDNSNADRNRSNSAEETRAAIHLAVTLVQWFSSGSIVKL